MQEEKRKSLSMRSKEYPATLFASIRETLGVLQMLKTKNDNREVCNRMLEGLSHKYKILRETLRSCGVLFELPIFHRDSSA